MQKGFTLIELLIVIAIVSVLAIAVILVINPVTLLQNSRIDSTTYEIKELGTLINWIKGLAGKTSIQITGSGCTDCSGCRSGTAVDSEPACVSGWNSALNAFQTQGGNLGLSQSLAIFKTDAFGSPYLIDENEGEGGGCTRDSLLSAGPDKIRGTSDDIVGEILNFSASCPR